MVECHLAKVDVAGSNPVSRSDGRYGSAFQAHAREAALFLPPRSQAPLLTHATVDLARHRLQSVPHDSVVSDLWYKNAVIYCLSVGAFMDANGDGVGDFEGLTRRLDYIAGLGVSCIWLMPFQRSPQRDDGYDVADHYTVDPRYGTLGDFVAFTHHAKQRGIRVIIDLVVNHTSDQHPWFQSARRDPQSPYRNWYLWSKKKPRNAKSGVVCPSARGRGRGKKLQKTSWSWDREARAYYFHRFHEFQPDLDTKNPEVAAEIRKIMGFWLQLGVSGFRLDAVSHLIETKGSGSKRPVERYEMLRDLREFAQWQKGDSVLLAEANVLPRTDLHYFGKDADRMHMMFNFQVNQHLFYALAIGDTRPLVKSLEATRARPPSAQWASFLRNHEELDLGRLTQKQRQRVFDAFGPDQCMQLDEGGTGRGIRRRLSPMLDGDQRRLQLAYSLMFTLPGTPVIRYGDEIGMGDDLSLPERACARTAMQWSTEPHGGFSRAKKPVVPVISGGPHGYERINVAEQRRDPESMLNWTERIIRMRMECPEIGWGDFRSMSTGSDSVLALRYDWRGNAVIAVHNLLGRAQEITLDVRSEGGTQLINLLSHDHSWAHEGTRHVIEMEPFGYRWFRVGGLDEVTKRAPS